MELYLVLAIVVVAAVLFATEKFSVDIVALLVLGALVATRLVTPAEGISGFSNPATVTVAAMFVLSAGLHRSGALTFLGRKLIEHGRNETLLLVFIMTAAALVSPFINNTAAVAIFLPLVITAAASRNVSASKLLIPLSFASQFGGVCTLFGTSTNLLVNSIAERNGLGSFGLFEFGQLGLIMVAAGMIYFLVLGRWLLPSRRTGQLTENYAMGDYLTELHVRPESPLIGKTAREALADTKLDVTIIEIHRGEQRLWNPASSVVAEGDVLLLRGPCKELFELKDKLKLELAPKFHLEDKSLQTEELELVEAIVAPQSRLAGRTLSEVDFHRRFHAVVLAMHRRGQVLRDKLADTSLRFGDTLLLYGPKSDIARLRANENFVIIGPPSDVSVDRRNAPLSLAIVALVVVLAAFKVLPIVATALLGCVAMVVTRCLRPEDAYRAIDWKVIMLLAGVLPLGLALERSGAAGILVDAAMSVARDAGPVLILGALYILTATLTEFMSNNAAAVLLAPVAIATAAKLGADPRPFLVAVAFAASTSFATPVGYQTNTMVYDAGGYRFRDFMKVGIPLNLIFAALATYFIPKFWPF
ncbi:MAG: SLC13 family permease [Opitutaceae bacterium]|nr:SLC13 family permease [Opitutaceae bacterium]